MQVSSFFILPITAYLHRCVFYRCPLKCFTKINENDRNNIFAKFYSLKTKDEQDIYLQGLIEKRSVGRRRKKKMRKLKNHVPTFILFLLVTPGCVFVKKPFLV